MHQTVVGQAVAGRVESPQAAPHARLAQGVVGVAVAGSATLAEEEPAWDGREGQPSRLAHCLTTHGPQNLLECSASATMPWREAASACCFEAVCRRSVCAVSETSVSVDCNCYSSITGRKIQTLCQYTDKHAGKRRWPRAAAALSTIAYELLLCGLWWVMTMVHYFSRATITQDHEVSTSRELCSYCEKKDTHAHLCWHCAYNCATCRGMYPRGNPPIC